MVETISTWMIFAVMLFYLSSTKKMPKKFRAVWDSNPDLCTACAMLHQLGYWANSELVITQVYDKPKDGEYT